MLSQNRLSNKHSTKESFKPKMSECRQLVGTGVSGRIGVTLTGALLGWVLLLGMPTTTYAANFALLLAVPSLFDQAILIVSFVALFGAIRVYGTVKGGLLAKSWQFFIIGLTCLVLAQLFQLADTAGLFVSPELLRPVILMAMAALFLLGVLKARRALS